MNRAAHLSVLGIATTVLLGIVVLSVDVHAQGTSCDSLRTSYYGALSACRNPDSCPSADSLLSQYNSNSCRPPIFPSSVGAENPKPAGTGSLPGTPITVSSLRLFVYDAIDMFMMLAAVITVGVFLWGAVKLIVSGGDTGKAEDGKKTMRYAAIGMAIILAVGIIINTIGNVARTGEFGYSPAVHAGARKGVLL
jgi:hypothetical protein